MNIVYALVLWRQCILSCATHVTRDINKLERQCFWHEENYNNKIQVTATNKVLTTVLRNFSFQFIHYDKQIINFRHNISNNCGNMFFMSAIRVKCSCSLCSVLFWVLVIAWRSVVICVLLLCVFIIRFYFVNATLFQHLIPWYYYHNNRNDFSYIILLLWSGQYATCHLSVHSVRKINYNYNQDILSTT